MEFAEQYRRTSAQLDIDRTTDREVLESLEQFRAEANVMAQLSGLSSIVEIYSADVAADARPYLVMEYCPPPTLAVPPSA